MVSLWLPGHVLAAGSLVAHWAFDETSGTTAADSSGNNYDGINTDATISTDVPTTAFANPRSLSFNGSTAVVEAPAQAALTGNHSRTISLWFKTAFDSANQGIFDSGSIGTNTAMEIYTVAANGAGLAPPTNPGGIAIVMWDNDIYVPLGIENVANNQWHFLTFTYDEATQQATLYFDGVAEQAYLWDGGGWSGSLQSQPFTTVNPLNTTANDVLIGQVRTGYFNSGNTFFTGSIDDVRIYDVAITPEQVGNLSDGSNDLSGPVSGGASPVSNPSSGGTQQSPVATLADAGIPVIATTLGSASLLLLAIIAKFALPRGRVKNKKLLQD